MYIDYNDHQWEDPVHPEENGSHGQFAFPEGMNLPIKGDDPFVYQQRLDG